MLAPEPFFEPRGTPFSEYHRIKALSELGCRIDLVTYPFGRDVALPGLRIHRCPRPPLLRGVRIGPSAAKILLDVLLIATAARLAHARLYDAVHSHEEAGVAGIFLAEWLGVPHLYDMHSSLPQQLANFGYDRSTLVRRLFEWAETLMVTRSRAIITICQELQDTAATLGAADRASLIENVMGGDFGDGAPPRAREIRARYGIDGERPLVLYTGTFEAYQGLDLLIEAAAVLEGTEHADLAGKFIDFMLSDAFQAQIPETMFVYPVIPGLDLPEWWSWAEVDVETASIEFTAEDVDRWIREWTEIMRR